MRWGVALGLCRGSVRLGHHIVGSEFESHLVLSLFFFPLRVCPLYYFAPFLFAGRIYRFTYSQPGSSSTAKYVLFFSSLSVVLMRHLKLPRLGDSHILSS
jgi:hypothetical protein